MVATHHLWPCRCWIAPLRTTKTRTRVTGCDARWCRMGEWLVYCHRRRRAGRYARCGGWRQEQREACHRRRRCAERPSMAVPKHVQCRDVFGRKVEALRARRAPTGRVWRQRWRAGGLGRGLPATHQGPFERATTQGCTCLHFYADREPLEARSRPSNLRPWHGSYMNQLWAATNSSFPISG